MNNVLEFTKCANCGACYNICPKQAITVNEDSIYYQIKIDENKCNSCGLCRKVCPVNNPKKKQQQVVSAYSLINNDDYEVRTSSSGGAFVALAKNVLCNNGEVYGAVYSEDYRTVNIACRTEERLDELKRSKYVESKVGNTFIEVKNKLENGVLILYCATPCQIAGLKRFLGREYDNLLTCDFTCGGLPSHTMYKEYIDCLEKKLKGTIIDVNFRPKVYGWNNYAIKVTSKKKTYVKWAFADDYFNCFIGKRLSIRDYCYECDFANNHYSDIILADLWKYRSFANVGNENKGISLLIANSQKGKNAIEKLNKTCAITVLDLERATYNLVDKKFNEELFKEHLEFVKKCEQKGFLSATKKYKTKNPLKFLFKYKVKKLLGKDV